MKYPENMTALCGLAPDMMGLIFYSKSPRYFDGELPPLPSSVRVTGVFVNEEPDVILKKQEHYNLGALQLHGQESPEYCKNLYRELQKAHPGVLLIKAISVGEAADLQGLEHYRDCTDMLLFDTRGKQPGGTGLTFDWELLKSYTLPHPFLLSGGIGPDHIPALQAFFNTKTAAFCQGIDINSRFETEPGLKNIADIRSFKEKLLTINEHKPKNL